VQRQLADGVAVSYLKTDAGRRDVPLADELVLKMRTHRLAARFSQEEDIVFASREGTHLSAGNVRKRGWHPAVERAGLPRLKFHQSRHAYASTLISARVPVTTVASVLGHGDPAITLRVYSHLFDRVASHDAVREAMTVALG
jgi:integrase